MIPFSLKPPKRIMSNFPTMLSPQTKQTSLFRTDAATTQLWCWFQSVLRFTTMRPMCRNNWLEINIYTCRYVNELGSAPGENSDLSCHCCGGIYKVRQLESCFAIETFGVYWKYNTYIIYKLHNHIYIYIIYMLYIIVYAYIYKVYIILPSRFLRVCLIPNFERCRCQGLLESHVLGVLKEYGIKAAGWEFVVGWGYHLWRPNSDAIWGDWQQRTFGQALILWKTVGASWSSNIRWCSCFCWKLFSMKIRLLVNPGCVKVFCMPLSLGWRQKSRRWCVLLYQKPHILGFALCTLLVMVKIPARSNYTLMNTLLVLLAILMVNSGAKVPLSSALQFRWAGACGAFRLWSCAHPRGGVWVLSGARWVSEFWKTMSWWYFGELIVMIFILYVLTCICNCTYTCLKQVLCLQYWSHTALFQSRNMGLRLKASCSPRWWSWNQLRPHKPKQWQAFQVGETYWDMLTIRLPYLNVRVCAKHETPAVNVWWQNEWSRGPEL